ncbi:MAG: OmpH family outer membrane protein [Candidatus Saganbacteria bacterium]|nr:OmpH family outer membrane protein [Candidatus Saganbacteria bacterium]
MKINKLIVAFFLFVFILTVGGAAFAADADLNSIGYIDVQKVFKSFKETDKAQDELKKSEEEFRKDFEKSQKKLEEAEKSGKTKIELEKMKEELEKDLSPKRENLLRTNELLTTRLQMQILSAVKKVAKNLGLEMVLDKQVVIYGGMDISEMVVNELNKEK